LSNEYESGVIREEFQLENSAGVIPGVLWTPQNPSTQYPLVMTLHGGSQHKEAEAILDLVNTLVRGEGMALACIDGPVHGERRADWVLNGYDGKQSINDFMILWENRDDNRIDDMISDLSSTLDFLLQRPEIDPGRVFWVGLSMGTAYGIPFVGSDKRVEAAIFGMWGLCYPNSDRLQDFAQNIRIPVRFHAKIDDSIMTHNGQYELFSAIASQDKEYWALPGGHADPDAHQLAYIQQFLRDVR